MVDSMLVGPKVMLFGHESRTWGHSGRRVIQNAENLYCSLGVIPKLIKVGIQVDLSSGSLDQRGSPSPDGWV